MKTPDKIVFAVLNFFFVAFNPGCLTDEIEPTSLQANPCVTLGASYLVQADAFSGSQCGPIADMVLNIATDGTITIPGECDKEPRYEAGPNGSCDVYLDNVRCEMIDPGKFDSLVETGTGMARWKPDGSSAEGVVTIQLEVELNGDSTTCQGTYHLRYTRL